MESGESVAPGMKVPVFFNRAKACWFNAATGQAV
jgi:hypothetical protein